MVQTAAPSKSMRATSFRTSWDCQKEEKERTEQEIYTDKHTFVRLDFKTLNVLDANTSRRSPANGGS